MPIEKLMDDQIGKFLLLRKREPCINTTSNLEPVFFMLFASRPTR